MTTITATWEPERAAVLLRVDPTSPVLSITRTDANGSAAVRLQEDAFPITDDISVRDYEAAHGLVAYSAATAAGAVTAEVTVTLTAPRLAAVVLPNARADLDLITGYESGRQPAVSVHQVIGRADPVPVLGPLRTRTGTLRIFCKSWDAAQEVVAVYAAAEVVLLRQPWYRGMDMYHVATGAVTCSPATEAGVRWMVEVPYTEVRRPIDDLRGAISWTYDRLAATGGTYAQVRGGYATYAALSAGPVA
ncbi:hypothetical protein [Cellulomonas sp. NPDC089187]|uniref:hypothetical protein n=1 Tax=Cellulomonas sp. NPDC089187 TaxID=3154970 RepID=UPI00343F09A6